MRVRVLFAISLTAGCSQTPAPVCPSPAAVAELDAVTDELAADTEPLEPASETSPDGLYACKRPTGDVVLTLRESFTAKDLVLAYMGVTCAHVLLPVELADRTRKTRDGFEGKLKPADLQPRFRALFDEMGLALVRERGAAIVVDQTWLAPRPGLMLLGRVDVGSVMLSSSPSIPPPLSDGELIPFDGIERVSDTHHRVPTAVVAEIMLAGPKGARLLPSVKNGQPNGVKLYAIRPSSWYAKVGLSNGDTVHSVNGVDVRAETQLEPANLFSARRLELAVTRRGKPLTLVIELGN
jgi:hypothetical protein